jgi:hypothetical protein
MGFPRLEIPGVNLNLTASIGAVHAIRGSSWLRRVQILPD